MYQKDLIKLARIFATKSTRAHATDDKFPSNANQLAWLLLVSLKSGNKK